MGLRYIVFLSMVLLLCASCQSDSAANASAAKPQAAIDQKEPEEKIAQQTADLAEKIRVRDSIKLVKETQVEKTAEITPVKEKEAEAVKIKDKPKKKPRKRRSPGIMTFAEPVFNYGKIEQGDVVMHEFSFVNTGKSELVINDIRASCGCTQPTYPFLPIAPGESGVIGVKFDSKGKLGKMKPMVTITTNADPAINKIYLEGFVDAPSKKSESPTQDSSLIQ